MTTPSNNPVELTDPLQLVERVALSFLAPLGYETVKSLAEASHTWVGNEADTPETGSLAYLCRALARAAIEACGIQSLTDEIRRKDEALAYAKEHLAGIREAAALAEVQALERGASQSGRVG